MALIPVHFEYLTGLRRRFLSGARLTGGVNVDTPQRLNAWGIPTEVHDAASTERYRSFTLRGADQIERYYLTHCRRLGANKLYVDGQSQPAIRFAVWAPNAQNVELVMGERSGGYIWSVSRNPGDR